MFDSFWVPFVNWVCRRGLVVTYIYQLLFTSAFLCTPVENSSGLEAIADRVLTPVHYLFSARTAIPPIGYSDSNVGDMYYRFEQKFDYNQPYFWFKTTASIVSLPFTFPAGVLLKSLSYLSPAARAHFNAIIASDASLHVESNRAYYQSIGLHMGDFSNAEAIHTLGLDRKPGDELNMLAAKLALRDIFQILQQQDIPAWVDCGTCLGAYRYGGIIPWDLDVDIAILEDDHDNAERALRALDPSKYRLVDLSPRSSPKTLFNIHVIETGDRIDVYHYRIDPVKKELFSIVAFERNIFISEETKFGDRMCAKPISFDTVFPLKKGRLDEILVPVPNQVVLFNQSKYGEDLRPVKLYDEKLNDWIKDLNHPYWQMQGAH